MATNTKINGSKYYKITRTIGHEIVDGKAVPIKKQFYGPSKTAALQKYEEWKEAQIRAEYLKKERTETITFGELAEEYVTDVLSGSSRYAKGTIERYTSVYRNYVKDSDLAECKMKEVKASTIQRFYNSLDVSAQVLKTIHKFMAAFYKWLILNDYSDNSLAAVELPRKEDNSRQDGIVIWEDNEISKILHDMDQEDHRLRFLVYLLLYSGLRISEAIALRYNDIRDDVIHVDRQHYLGETKDPKYGSKRQIPIHSELVPILNDHKKWHQREMQAKGYNTDHIFTTSTGNLYQPSSIRHALERFYARHEIPYKHIHAYRATFCTQLCRCGVPLEVASKLMGHKSMEVTAKHYALVRQETQREAIDKLAFKKF